MKTFVMVVLSTIFFQGLAIAGTQKTASGPLFLNDNPPLIQTTDNHETDEANAGRNECWSAKKCKGKILNNKDAHNCKKSGGKSWRGKNSTQCVNL
ncbi:hypothetical protein GQC79_005421 [Salmonella enterica]|nr:hypothetical protein [Salmonella enterica]